MIDCADLFMCIRINKQQHHYFLHTHMALFCLPNATRLKQGGTRKGLLGRREGITMHWGALIGGGRCALSDGCQGKTRSSSQWRRIT